MIAEHFNSEHFNAVESWLGAEAPLAGKVYDSAREGSDGLILGNYVILFGGKPYALYDDRFSAPQRPNSKAEFLYTVRSVGTTPDAVRMLGDAVDARMIGAVLSIDGRKCDRIRLDDGDDPVHKEKGVTLYYSDADYVLVSRPA